jgi:hypothetical protein
MKPRIGFNGTHREKNTGALIAMTTATAPQSPAEIKAALIDLYENLIKAEFEKVQSTVAAGGAIDFTDMTKLQNTLAEIKARKVA